MIQIYCWTNFLLEINVNSLTGFPSKKGAKFERRCDWWLYKERHLVEKYFLKLKGFRRIATRYDKLAYTHMGFVCESSLISASRLSTRKILSRIPSSIHLRKRLYTEFQGPQRSGRSRLYWSILIQKEAVCLQTVDMTVRI